MNIDFEKLKFELNWASGIVIVTLLVSTITLYLNNKSLEDKIDSMDKNITKLSESVQELSKSVNILNGSDRKTSEFIGESVKHPPSEFIYRLDRIEQVVFGIPVIKPTKAFVNRLPN